MADDLVLYTNPMSRGRIARWMLEEVGRPYRTEVVGYGPAMKTADYLAINPMGKVPALRHGDVIVTEGAAILAYLADAFPQAGLAPAPTDPARGAYYRWLFFGAGPLEAAVTNTSFSFDIPPEHEGRAGYGSLGRVLDTLESALLRDDYLAGGRFSAADLYIGSQLGFGMQFGIIEKRPPFEAYFARLAARPAAERARELDDAAAAAAGPPAEGFGSAPRASSAALACVATLAWAAAASTQRRCRACSSRSVSRSMPMKSSSASEVRISSSSLA
jgi:glutathione S-transferase